MCVLACAHGVSWRLMSMVRSVLYTPLRRESRVGFEKVSVGDIETGRAA